MARLLKQSVAAGIYGLTLVITLSELVWHWHTEGVQVSKGVNFPQNGIAQ